MKRKILISSRIPSACIAPYQDRFDFTMPDDETAFSYEYILQTIGRYDAFLDIGMTVDKPVIDVCVSNGVKAIANYGVGYDKIDWKYATERALPILNTPNSVTEATAELGATLIFSIMRGIARYDSQIRQNIWHSPLFSDENTMISGSTLGIVGFGRIGKSVARKAQGMGMKVIYYDRYRADASVEAERNVPYFPLDELLSASDVVSLHMPYFPENHHMFNAETFKRMKPSAYFVNTARGKLVDESALCAALRGGAIKGAALDVFEYEPDINPDLLTLDNIILTPHIASLTMRSRTAMAHEALDGLATILEGGIPANVVNPSVFGR